MYACSFVYFQFLPRDSVIETRTEHLSAHTAILVRNMDKGFITAREGKQGGECFGKETEKEENSQQVRNSLSI